MAKTKKDMKQAVLPARKKGRAPVSAREALEAIESLQAQAKVNGVDKMSDDEIDAIIRQVREDRARHAV